MKKIINFCKEKSFKLFSLILTLVLMLCIGVGTPGVNAATPIFTYFNSLNPSGEYSSVYISEEDLLRSLSYELIASGIRDGEERDLITFESNKLKVLYSGGLLGYYMQFPDGTNDYEFCYVSVDTVDLCIDEVMIGTSLEEQYLNGDVYYVFKLLNTSDGNTVTESITEFHAYNITQSSFGYLPGLENKAPVINGGETAYVTNVDDPLTVDEIKATLQAYDNEDGDISSKIVVDSDNYSANKNKVGTHTIVFSVTDTAGNKSILTVSVYVTDTQAATITGPTSYNADEKTKTSIDSLKALLTFTDNYYETSRLTITVESDNYSSNYNKLGTYAVTFKCVDPSGNISRHTINVKVNDTTNPVFSGPTSIIKNQSVNMTLADITAQISASDNGDGVVTSKIVVKEDNFTGCGNKAGSYTIVYQVTDTAGNSATHTVTVQVKDNIPPVWYVPNYCIKVSQLESLTRDDIVEILVASGQIAGSSEKSINFTTNEYEGNEDIPGMYAVGLQVKSSDGTQSDINLYVEVLEDEEADVVVPGDDETPSDDEIIEKQWYEIVGDWFLSSWLGLAIWVWFVFGALVVIIIILCFVAGSKDRGYKHYNRRRY